MGLRDKIAAKLASMGIDHQAVLSEQLGAGDAVVACGGMIPSAYERGGSGSVSSGNRLVAKALNVATNAVSQNRHIGGEEGSIARSLPLDTAIVYGAVSTSGLSLWDFGPTGQYTPPELITRLADDQIRSVVDTGTKAQGGASVVRFTFADDSFFDYRVLPVGADFLAACIQRWPA